MDVVVVVVFLLLFSYHRRLGMTLRSTRIALGRRTVSHSWGMGVISHSYGGFGGDRDGGGGCRACGTKPRGVGGMSGDDRPLPESEVELLMTPDHTAMQMRSSG